VPGSGENDAQKQQRAWDEKTFKPAPAAPPDADAEGMLPPPGSGKAGLPPELATDAAGASAAAKNARPEDLRPDLPWLKDLAVGDLPVRWDARVIKYLEYYKDDPKGHAIMAGWLAAQARFRPMILDALRKAGLPEDLIYVCMIESSYDPWDRSDAGASGLWQFMPAGGRIYGLEQNYWVDERNDPEKSTAAAVIYWKDLYDRFGDWHLALAAYNTGFGAVLKAIAKFNTNDYWTLSSYENGISWGAQIYVPKAIAAAIVGHNRKVFGFDSVQDAPLWDFDRVTVEQSASLAAIAKASGATVDDIRYLNPELKRTRTPAGVKNYVVRIPRGKKELFARSFPQLRGDWDGFDAYVVRHGERFEDIATTYGLSPQKLRELNGVADIGEVRGGTIIVVPKIDDATREANRKKAEEDLYRPDPKQGDPGDPLIVPVADKTLALAGKKRVFYRVVAGDTLDDVADALGVKAPDLAAWNALASDAAIQPRMVLEAFVDPKFDPDARHVALLDDSRLMIVTSNSDEHLDIVEGRKGRKRVHVQAKKGDTLESLGKPHNLDKYDMARINHMNWSKPLDPGQDVIVYVVVDKAKARKAGVFDKKKHHAAPSGPRQKLPKGK
jgi:membrane-bound lytic murein transglycosylase D